MNPDIIEFAKKFITKRAEFGSMIGSNKDLEIALMLDIHECIHEPTIENYAVTLMVADEILRRAGETNTTEVPITYSE